MPSPILNLLAIDPGDVHQGVSYFEIDIAGPTVEEFLASPGEGGVPTLRRHWTRDLSRQNLLDLVETASVDAIVVEEFRLYPDMARQQGYSDFKTSKVIGVLEFIAYKRGLPCYIQGASLKKKARRIGERLGFPGKERWIGTGRGRYWGWDFDGPSQHERDATAHGTWWAFRNADSPIYEMDSKQKARLEVAS